MSSCRAPQTRLLLVAPEAAEKRCATRLADVAGDGQCTSAAAERRSRPAGPAAARQLLDPLCSNVGLSTFGAPGGVCADREIPRSGVKISDDIGRLFWILQYHHVVQGGWRCPVPDLVPGNIGQRLAAGVRLHDSPGEMGAATEGLFGTLLGACGDDAQGERQAQHARSPATHTRPIRGNHALPCPQSSKRVYAA